MDERDKEYEEEPEQSGEDQEERDEDLGNLDLHKEGYISKPEAPVTEQHDPEEQAVIKELKSDLEDLKMSHRNGEAMETEAQFLERTVLGGVDDQVVPHKEQPGPLDWAVPKPKFTACRLGIDGNIHPKNMKGGVRRDETGAYPVHRKALYWNDRPIPRGWAIFHLEGNPIPVQDGPFPGYDAKTMQTVTGPWLPGVVGASYKSNGVGLPGGKGLLVVGGIIAAIFLILQLMGGG